MCVLCAMYILAYMQEYILLICRNMTVKTHNGGYLCRLELGSQEQSFHFQISYEIILHEAYITFIVRGKFSNYIQRQTYLTQEIKN